MLLLLCYVVISFPPSRSHFLSLLPLFLAADDVTDEEKGKRRSYD